MPVATKRPKSPVLTAPPQPAMPSSAPTIGSGAVPPVPQAPASPFSPNAVPPPVSPLPQGPASGYALPNSMSGGSGAMPGATVPPGPQASGNIIPQALESPSLGPMPPKQPLLPNQANFGNPNGPVYGPTAGGPGDTYGQFDPVQRAISFGDLGRNVGSKPVRVAPVGPQSRSLLGGGQPISGPTGASMASAQYAKTGPMTNEQAQANYANSPKDSRYMPSTTVGGLFGAPTRNVDDLIKKDQGIARQGNYRESMLADMNKRPSSGGVGLAPPKQFPETDFKPTGNFKPSNTSQAAKDAAKATFDARRGGTAQRQADYQARTADNQWMRSANVQKKAIDRTEARRERLGNITPAEVLERMNPLAAAQKGVAQAQIASTAQTRESDRLFRASEGEKNRTSAESRTKMAAEGMAAAHGMPSPFAPPVTPPAKADDIPSPGELKNLPPAERAERVAHLPPATRERVLAQADRQGFVPRLFGDIDQPRQAPVSEAIKNRADEAKARKVPATFRGIQAISDRIGGSLVNTPELVGLSPKARQILADDKAKKAKPAASR